jgi:sulfate permease, SulP family
VLGHGRIRRPVQITHSQNPSRAPGTFGRLIPALHSLRNYGPSDARGDLVAGLTVAAVAVPQAMAYAMVAGLPVEYGLYTAIVMTTVGALFDSSRQLINGPTNAISIAVLSVIGTFHVQEQRIEAAILLAFMVGAIQLAITFLRLGDLSRYISHSVIVGFTAGAGTLLVLDQIKNLVGWKAMGDPHDHFLSRFWLSTSEGVTHMPTAMVGVGSVALVLLLRWLKARLSLRLLPDLLVVVVIAAWLVDEFGLEAQGVRVIGQIPSGFPAFATPHFDADVMRQMASGALAIAVLGLLEAIAMAKAIASLTRQRIDMNQQCLSEGLANFAGSFFHCYPGSGSLTRSAINHQAGASTQWSGVVSAGAVALTMWFFAPYAQHIPRAALAGILVVSAFKMIDWDALRYHLRATHFDKAVVLVTAVSAIAISIEFCVLVGVFMSFLLAVPRVGQTLLTEFVITEKGGIHERLPEDETCSKILIFGVEGELFFGAAASLERHLDAIEARVSPDTHVVVLRMKRARNPDAVCLHLLAGFLERMKARDVQVLMCGVRAELLVTLQKSGLIEQLGEKNLFPEQAVRQTSTLLAIRYAYTLLPERCARCPRGDSGQDDQPLYYAI